MLISCETPQPVNGNGVNGKRKNGKRLPEVVESPDQHGEVDLEAIKGAVRTILEAVGEDPDRPGLLDTPRRVARMYEEMFAGLHKDPARHLKVTFPEDYDEMVLVRDIQFTSMCEHHLLPFSGVARRDVGRPVAQLPDQHCGHISVCSSSRADYGPSRERRLDCDHRRLGDRAAVSGPKMPIGRPTPCVENDEASHGIGTVHGGDRHTDRTAPVLHNKNEVIKPKMVNQRCDTLGVLFRRVAVLRWMLGEAETWIVGSDAPACPVQFLDYVAVQIRPRWVSMQEENRRAAPFIHIVHGRAEPLEPMVRERVIVGADRERAIAHGVILSGVQLGRLQTCD